MRAARAALLFALVLGAPPVRAQTAGTCTGGSATSDLDIGGVRARLYNNGGLFWKGAGNVYNVPKSPVATFLNPNAVFAQGMWLGGYVGSELRQAAATYSNWEFYPGPLGPDAQVPGGDCRPYDRIYNVSVRDVEAYNRTRSASRDLAEWPVLLGAPVVDGDGVPGNYNLAGGDRPEILGHQSAFWVMNDVGGPHLRTGSKPLGVEVRVTAHAFKSPSDALYYSTVYRYTFVSRNTVPITEAYFGLWSDPDLGNAADDYLGSDTTLRLGYVYNADNSDEGSDGYGAAPPALGWKLLDGPPVHDENRDGRPDAPGFSAFSFYDGSVPSNTEPRPLNAYLHMRGRWQDGRAMYACGDGFAAVHASCGTTRWMCSGDPTAPAGQRFWSELEPTRGAATASIPSDRRIAMGSGPFTLAPNAPVTVTMAMVWARGGSNLESITRMKAAAREVQAVYDANGFRNLPQRPDPPTPTQAPALVGPADGIGGQPAYPLVSWEAVPGATFYEVEFRALGDAPIGDVSGTPLDTVLSPFLSARLPIDAPGRYAWRVRAATEGGVGPWSEAFSFRVSAPELYGGSPFENFLVTRNAAGRITPLPEYGALDVNHRGFPRVAGTTNGENPTSGKVQSTNASVWGVHTTDTDATDEGFPYFVSRVLRDGFNQTALGGNAYELRFTGTSLARNAFTDGAHYTVPFELWDAGRTESPDDDVRLVPWINPITGGIANVFDFGADHPTSGGINDPQTDAIFWMRPTDTTPGQSGYLAVEAAMQRFGSSYSSEGIKEEVMARVVLVCFNCGTQFTGPFIARLPEPGTVFRIVGTERPAVILSSPRNGITAPTPQVRLAWQEPNTRVLRRYVEVATDEAFTNVVLRDTSVVEPYLLTPPLTGGVRYYWRVRLRVSPSILFSTTVTGTLTTWSSTGVFTAPLSSAVGEVEAAPASLTLGALYPNPAGDGPVTVRYGLPAASPVRIRLFDMLGRAAAPVQQTSVVSGWHTTTVDAATLAPGVYVLRLEAGGHAVTRTLVVAR